MHAPPTIRRDSLATCSVCPVRALDLFVGIDAPRAEALLQGIDHFICAPRAIVYASREKAPFLYIVRSGLVKLSHFSLEGEERIVRILKAGDALGLEALFGEPYHHTARALTEARLCRVPVPLLEQLDREVPDFHRQLLRQFQRSLNEAEAVLTDLSTGTARGRVARLLLFLARDHGAAACTLIGREDMGAILGITTESASRVIAAFRRLGIFGRSRGGLCECDLERLGEIARGIEPTPRKTLNKPP